MLFHHQIQHVAAGADAVERQRGERLVHDIHLREQVVLVGLDVEDARRELAERANWTEGLAPTSPS